MVLGPLLPFLTISSGSLGIPTQTIGGLRTPDGKLSLGLGAFAIVFGIAILLGRGLVPRAMGALALAAGGTMLGQIVADLPGLREQGLQALARIFAGHVPGVSSDQYLEALRAVGASVDPGVGLYVALTGGAFAAVGGLWALLTRTARPAPSVPPP